MPKPVKPSLSQNEVEVFNLFIHCFMLLPLCVGVLFLVPFQVQQLACGVTEAKTVALL